jgi:acyl-CoA dehydrogenase
MPWDFSTEPEFQSKLDWMSAFVRERIWPLETLIDELGWEGLTQAIRPLQDEVKDQGLWAAHLDPELGGQGFGQVKLGLMHEILGTSPIAPLAFGNAAPDSGNSEILALAGTPEQTDRYLFPLLAGDLKSAFSMTEPDTAGSDPTLLKTTAERDGDHWVINGHKWFSSNGSIADFLIVMAVTDADARPHQRASMFIVDADTPGVNIVRDVATMEHPYDSFGRYGNHAEIRYEDVRIPAQALLGMQGAGFPIAQQRLYPAWTMDTEGVAAARKQIALIKFYGAQALHDVVDRAIQAHGALGYSTDLPLEAMYRYARAARIYDGPDEVHRASVARQVLRGYEAPPDGVPSEHGPTRREAARRQFAELLEAVTAND